MIWDAAEIGPCVVVEEVPPNSRHHALGAVDGHWLVAGSEGVLDQKGQCVGVIHVGVGYQNMSNLSLLGDRESARDSAGIDRHPVVELKYYDDLGQPLDRAGIVTPGSISFSFVFAWYDGDLNQFTAYTVRPAGDYEQATSDSGGSWEDVTIGHSFYTFGTQLPEGYDMTKTHTMYTYATRNTEDILGKTYYSDPTYDFRPDGGEVGQGRVVRQPGERVGPHPAEGDVELCSVDDGEPYCTTQITPRIGGPPVGLMAGGGKIPPVAIVTEGSHRLVAIDVRKHRRPRECGRICLSWEDRLLETVAGLSITFSAISLYGFSDMATFLKKG